MDNEAEKKRLVRYDDHRNHSLSDSDIAVVVVVAAAVVVVVEVGELVSSRQVAMVNDNDLSERTIAAHYQ